MSRSDDQKRQAQRFAFLPSLLLLLAPRAAAADDTIKHPGDHPDYSLEAEPHLLLGWGYGYGGEAVGVGGRFSIPVMRNGFVSEINDSVAIGFGLDVLFYNSCYYSGSCSATYFDFPVVMQWNFFVAKRFSVFGEPGLVFYHDTYGACPLGNACPGGPSLNGVVPAIYLGGRYHLSESTALTLRLGFPSLSFGVSFFL
jgi:hypothetical protein